MKQLLLTIVLVLALSMNVEAIAQKHRHTPRTEQVDSTKAKDAIEAFSDTTTVADDSDSITSHRHIEYSEDDAKEIVREVFSNIDSKAVMGMLTAVGIIFILFVLFPIIVIIAVVFFINRNRKERLKLAQMAMQNGQPIPEQLLKEEAVQNSGDYQKGVRQMFTGIGLAIFLGIVAGKVGFGIGALVFFIGLGKWYIARQSGNTGFGPQSMNNPSDNINHSNDSNIQDYD